MLALLKCVVVFFLFCFLHSKQLVAPRFVPPPLHISSSGVSVCLFACVCVWIAQRDTVSTTVAVFTGFVRGKQLDGLSAIRHEWHEWSGQTDRPAEEVWAHQGKWGQSSVCQSQVITTSRKQSVAFTSILMLIICLYKNNVCVFQRDSCRRE